MGKRRGASLMALEVQEDEAEIDVEEAALLNVMLLQTSLTSSAARDKLGFEAPKTVELTEKLMVDEEDWSKEPWQAKPLICVLHLLRTGINYLDDLLVHKKIFAWFQLGLAMACFVAAAVGGIQAKQKQALIRGFVHIPVMSGYALILAALAFSFKFCNLIVPLTCALVVVWIMLRLPGPAFKHATEPGDSI
eukprot:CAMPEP_0197661498 /NCGR_PEP_ID=MMETSP1338-20131121/51493_1 /TAXON_ID=43686 ORGANISM="Pelagodinium beii, Strain RCC1491" /NCGR_SAMPLE_ID=MMETSP1338 /ASSEMBLY_ACC=CAM_ASM_000754 /LENGTH=191 /DNA_ID=CAMNT_0043239063 /DNA_START=126 /DNA_END=702 /DNA_ORIENTATION=-